MVLAGVFCGFFNTGSATPCGDEIRALLPAAATPAIIIEADSRAGIQSSPDQAAYSIIPIADAPFDSALRIEVPKGYPNPWDVVVHRPKIDTDLVAGRVLLATIWICAEVTQGGQSGTAKVFLERSPEWEGLGETGGTLDAHWRKLVHRDRHESALPSRLRGARRAPWL